MSTPVIPADVTYSRFHGTFLLARQDGPDADTRPDPGFAVGTVTFTPSVERLIVPASGAVIWLEPTYSAPIAADGTFELEVPATDASGVIPTEWTYDVSVNVTGKKPWVFTTNAPAGADRNILQAVTFPSTQGTLITRGDPGPRGVGVMDAENVDGNLVLLLTDESTTAPVPLPLGDTGPRGEPGVGDLTAIYPSTNSGYYLPPYTQRDGGFRTENVIAVRFSLGEPGRVTRIGVNVAGITPADAYFNVAVFDGSMRNINARQGGAALPMDSSGQKWATLDLPVEAGYVWVVGQLVFPTAPYVSGEMRRLIYMSGAKASAFYGQDGNASMDYLGNALAPHLFTVTGGGPLDANLSGATLAHTSSIPQISVRFAPV